MTDTELISAAMAILSRRRRSTERTCQQCGKSYTGTGHGRFCHPYCRRLAWRTRKKAEKINDSGMS